MKKLIIIGASGHGEVVADVAKKLGYTDIVFLDDDASKTEFAGYSVTGAASDTDKYPNTDIFVAIGNAGIRERIQGGAANIVTLIHPNAVIAENVKIGKGSVVMAGAVINPGVVIGDGCIINTCSSVDHDCRIGNYVHVSVGAHVAGTVSIGDRTWIGAGATVSNNIHICEECTIGAGAVVVKDIDEKGTYAGVPAMRIK